MALFGVKLGLKIFGSDAEADVLNGIASPAVAGVAAPEGSLYLRQNGVSYKKIGPLDTDWKPYSEIEGDGLLWSTISGAKTAEASKGYILDTNAAAFTVTLPGSPEEGDTIGFAGLGDIETHNVTVSLNGKNMNGCADDLIIDLNYCYFEMLYTGNAATGWVLSNTDESGNVDNIQDFIGSSNNANPAVTEFTEENYIVSGDSLEDAIDKLDMAMADGNTTASGLLSLINANTTNIHNNDVDISALEIFTGSNGDEDPNYSSVYYVADGDDLEAAIGKLDAALRNVDSVAATGVNWRASVLAATSSVISEAVGAYGPGSHFADDEVPFYAKEMWADGDQVLSINTTTSGFIYTWDGTEDKFTKTDQLGANEAVSVRFDFPDGPGSQEDGAAYMMKSDLTGVIKIADFDFENAASIALSSGYTAGLGVISSNDSVESAIQKLDGLSAANAAAIVTNTANISTNAGDIDDLEAAVGSSTGLAGMDYTSTNYVTVDTSLVAAISALDGALDDADTIIANHTTLIANNTTSITNVDTAHDNLADAVLKETSTSVTANSTDTVLDTVTQAGNLGAKWFVVAYAGTKRYAAEIYAMHDGSTNADITEYAILTIGTPKLKIEFDIVADGTNMSLVASNGDASVVTIKAQRITVQMAAVDTTAVLV